MFKAQAHKLSPLVNNPEAWEALQEYLQEQINQTYKALGVAKSESEMFHKQGSLASLVRLKNLKEESRMASNVGDKE